MICCSCVSSFKCGVWRVACRLVLTLWGMEASVFKAMVAALVERPEEINAGGALDNHHEEESSQFVPMDQPHLPLVKADPNAFYSDTAFFAKPPTRPARFLCSSGRRCGQPAVVICFSCVRFDEGRGHYCRGCFDIFHPWYRVAHKWAPVEDAEGAREQMDQQAYRTTIERTVADIRGLLHSTSSWVGELESQDADTKGGDIIKEAARDATRVGLKIRDLADMTCEDRTTVSKVAMDTVMLEAARFQKEYESQETLDREARSVH